MRHEAHPQAGRAAVAILAMIGGAGASAHTLIGACTSLSAVLGALPRGRRRRDFLVFKVGPGSLRRHAGTLHAQVFKLIVVALDGSALAERALPYARELGRSGDIVLIRVQPPMPAAVSPIGSDAAPTIVDVEELFNAVSAETEQYLSVVADRLRAEGARVRYERPEGDPKRLLPSRAAELAADLIVVTTHGRSGIRRILFGSVTEAVVREAHCPVLVIPAQDR